MVSVVRGLVLLLAGSALSLGVRAQSFPVGTASPLPSRVARSASVGAALPTLPLEGVVDARAYRVGPGDVFTVTVGGPEPAQANVPVGADGVIMLLVAGGVRVGNLSLDDARRAIVGRLREFFRNVTVDASLTVPRTFYVHVTGAVPLPGRKPVTAVGRLEDAVALSFDTLDVGGLRAGFAPSFRAVEVQRRSGESRTFDLVRYRRTGDLAENPYLEDGDNIVVPSYDFISDAVFVNGAVAFPGPYALRPGDTVLDLVVVAGGEIRPGDSRRVRVGNGPWLKLSDLTTGTAPPVGPRSQVYVEGERLAGIVSVEGAVGSPGSYPIREGETTLRALLEAAGGLVPQALPRGAYIERRGGRPQERGRPEQGRTDADVAARAVQVPGDAPFVTRTALAELAYGANRVVIDVERALAGDASADLVLYDGDRLVVPRDERTVLVVGSVGRPGYVPVRAGADVAFYLREAGGLRRSAGDILVAEGGLGRLRPANEVGALRSGDVVFVLGGDLATRPDLASLDLQERQVRLSEANARRESRFRTITTTLGVVSTVATVVTTAVLLAR